jgi:hypothetical protein
MLYNDYLIMIKNIAYSSKTFRAFRERDSSGTTRQSVAAARDGADSPTRGGKAAEAARPNP